MALRFYSGVFIVTAATLMLQIIQTRILSVVAWYHLAFFVISTAMFGLTVGAVWVYQRRDRFTEHTLSHDLAHFTSAFAVTTALSLMFQMTLVPLPGGQLTTTIIWFELAVCTSVPFFFSGVVVSLALSRSPYPIGRVYGVDLAGAAAGCLGVLALLNLTDAPSAILWVSAMTMAAAVLFANTGIGAKPAVAPAMAAPLRRHYLSILVLACFALGNSILPQQSKLKPIFVKGKIEMIDGLQLFEEWNSFSRIGVFRDESEEPQMWGPSPRFRPEDWPISQRKMNIDGDAATMAYELNGNVAAAGFLKYDVTNLAYHLAGQDRAAIIGVGGGRDILSARLFGISDITGVEINPILVRLQTQTPGFAEFTGLGQLDGVTFEVDEARSWFARSQDRFDVIQMSLIDTWAATGAGAFTLSENGLYTVEAWRIFLQHLTPDGVYTVSRWHARHNIDETGRMLSVAIAALMEEGASDPRRQIYLASAGNIATLIVSRSPLSADRLATLDKVTRDMDFKVLVSPGSAPASPVLRNIMASRNRAELEAHTSNLPLDLTPSTDERPFFFNQLPLHHAAAVALGPLSGGGLSVGGGNLLATTTLVKLFGISLVLVIGTIVLPLRPAISDVGRPLALAGSAYFFLIGAGFMMIEIGLLQRFSVFLGHPIYALSIVLFSMILATGVGSLISDRLPLDNRARIVIWATATAAYLGALPHWLPELAHAYDGASLLSRALICILATTPAGLLMGFGFPTGMRLISAVDRGPTPWFWGINGAAGVLASTVAVACSITFGINMTLTVGAICYFMLIAPALALAPRHQMSAVPEPA